jgi:lysozyme
MQQEQKINLSPEQILTESRRIRDRDFEALNRHFYRSDDHVLRWSDKELEKKVQDTVNRVKGIDVSSYQNTIDWKQVKDAGYQFAFIKASEGIDWVDPSFAANRAGARDAGLTVGYYHYFRPNDAVDAQVKNFVATVGKAEPNSLRLVIDAEDPAMWAPYSVQQRAKMIQEWCSGVQKALGVAPQISIYASPNFVNQVLQNAPGLSKYNLWIANYNVPEPNVPKPWSTWDFWQYSDSGKVPGITAGGGVDLDMYNGNTLKAARKGKHQ